MITLAGYPLPYYDHAGELQQFQARFQSLCEANVFASEPAAVRSLRSGTRTLTRSGVGLPRPNYPPPTQPRLQSLYWPTGASRWARGYFLADDTTKTQIVRAAGLSSAGTGSDTTITLQFGDDSSSENPIFSASMYLLPPRPVSAQEGSGRVWVLPLVDVRYWWQFADSGNLSLTSSSTWATLFSSLGSGLIGGGLNPDMVNAAYLVPDWEELNRAYENVAVMLDAAAASVGHRVVRGWDGSQATQTKATADTKLNANQQIAATLQAGAEFSDESGDFPAQVRVTFPKFSQGVGYCGGDLYTYTNGPGGGVVTNNTEKVIHSSCYADFSSGSGTPSNDTALSALAAQIATDFYAWKAKNYDYTFNSVVNWQPCGHDDYIEWTFGGQLPNGQYLAQTRVQNFAHDFGVDQQCSQDSTLHIIDSWGIKGLYNKSDNSGTDPWTSGTYAQVRVYTGSGAGSYAGYKVKAFNLFGSIPDGNTVWLSRDCDGWYPTSTVCP
jgi:hypothetical protein